MNKKLLFFAIFLQLQLNAVNHIWMLGIDPSRTECDFHAPTQQKTPQLKEPKPIDRHLVRIAHLLKQINPTRTHF